jgi:hypothetical protein
MAKVKLTALLASAAAWRYECVVRNMDRVEMFDRSSGRAATREVRRVTKSFGPNAHGSVVLVYETRRGATKRKTIHQCSTDERGRLSARGEEV